MKTLVNGIYFLGFVASYNGIYLLGDMACTFIPQSNFLCKCQRYCHRL